MNERVYIKSEFINELTALSNGYSQDYIDIYKTDKGKVYFSYGKCKLHVTEKELEEYRLGEA